MILYDENLNVILQNNKYIKIKIIGCSKDSYWYHDKIGNIFDVEKCCETEYLKYKIKTDYGLYNFFDYRDVEEVKETKMKVVEKNTKANEKYPCLKTDNNGLIVLFVGPQKGCVIKKSVFACNDIGYYSDCWYEDHFTPYSGTLEISNGD